jgi:putative membrane protein
MMHWGNFGGMGAGGFGFGWIFMILFWTLLILGVVYLMKQLFGTQRTVSRTETAEDILKMRYASGEISRDEYIEKKSLISQKS